MATSLEKYHVLIRDFTQRFMPDVDPARVMADQQIEISGRRMGVRLRAASPPTPDVVALLAPLGAVYVGQEDALFTRLLQLNNLCVRTEGFTLSLDGQPDCVVVQTCIPLDYLGGDRLLQMLLRMNRVAIVVEQLLDPSTAPPGDDDAARVLHELPGASHA